MAAKKRKLDNKKPKKHKTCCHTKLELAIKKMEELSQEAEDFFHTVEATMDKDENDGRNK